MLTESWIVKLLQAVEPITIINAAYNKSTASILFPVGTQNMPNLGMYENEKNIQLRVCYARIHALVTRAADTN